MFSPNVISLDNISTFTYNRYLSVGDELDNRVLEEGSGTDVLADINSPLGRSCSSPDTAKGFQISPLLWPSELKFYGEDLSSFHEERDGYFNQGLLGMDNKRDLSSGLNKNEEQSKLFEEIGQSTTGKRVKNKRSQANELDGVMRKTKIQKTSKSLWSHEYLFKSTELNREKCNEEVKAERAIRNRESARRSRMRSKAYFEKLEKAFEQLQKENRILKLIIAKKIPQSMTKIEEFVQSGNEDLDVITNNEG